MPEETPLNSLIEDCWAALPSHRPSFDEIYERLRVLQRPINQNFEGEGSAGAGPSQLPSADAE